MRCKLSPQSHFTCLLHDHEKCSCIGGPHRLVQSHFTCHTHELSSSLFLVLVHRMHSIACSMLCFMFLFSSFCCSSVLLSLPRLLKTFHIERALFTWHCHNIWFPLDEHSIYADRHVGILALLLSSASLRLAYIRRASRPLAWTRFKGYFDIGSKSEQF